MLTCTWAPSSMTEGALFAPEMGLERSYRTSVLTQGEGADVRDALTRSVQTLDGKIDYLLIPQRWYGAAGTGRSSYDVYAMTAIFAAATEQIRLVPAVHPGFVLPAVVAKWGATLDRISGGRWAINVTAGWSIPEFASFGADLISHDKRYDRASEFIHLLRDAWTGHAVDFTGDFYSAKNLIIEPPPVGALEVFQGGQSDAARNMAAAHSDWMYLNGGPPERISPIIRDVRDRAAKTGRVVRFALYATPLCRDTDQEAESEIARMIDAIDTDALEQKKTVTDSAGMWTNYQDKLSQLDLNEGYASRLYGSPDTIRERIKEFADIGVDMLHLSLKDDRFNRDVLPKIADIASSRATSD